MNGSAKNCVWYLLTSALGDEAVTNILVISDSTSNLTLKIGTFRDIISRQCFSMLLKTEYNQKNIITEKNIQASYRAARRYAPH